MPCTGQLSLEYLLLLAAGLCIFAALLPLLNNVYELGLFGLDNLNAKRFALDLQQRVEEMSFQADGTATMVEAEPATNWTVSSSGSQLLVTVQGPESREKQFSVLFPDSLGLPNRQVTAKTSFVLKKQGGRILLEYN